MPDDVPPDKQTFEILGFFEEVWDVRTGKLLGLRRCFEQPGRVVGFHGAKEERATSDIHLDNGFKKTIVKASPRRPLRIRTIYLPQCGRMLSKVEQKDVERTCSTINLHKHHERIHPRA